MKLSQAWSRPSAVFDDENLVSFAGLVSVLGLAERARLTELIEAKVALSSNRVASAGVNPAGKLTAIIAGMATGADSIDDLDVIRSGGMAKFFDGVYAAATLGQFFREFTGGHVAQLASVARAHLVNLIGCTDLLPGLDELALVDIDSLLRPVYGHAKEGASFGHTKIAGRQVLRKGLSPLVTTISTASGAPVIAGIRLRSGKTGSGKAAASMVREAIKVARCAGASGEVLVRGDCAYGNGPVVAACRAAGAWAICAAITHNLLRAAGTLAGGKHAVARGATLRRRLIAVPARPARPQRRPVLHLPAHWPWATPWKTLWEHVFPAATGPPAIAS